MILKPVFIIAIVAVAMIGVMVPSVFANELEVIHVLDVDVHGFLEIDEINQRAYVIGTTTEWQGLTIIDTSKSPFEFVDKNIFDNTYALDISESTNKLYVMESHSNSISVLDGYSFVEIDKIDLDFDPNDFRIEIYKGLVVNDSTQKIYLEFQSLTKFDDNQTCNYYFDKFCQFTKLVIVDIQQKTIKEVKFSGGLQDLQTIGKNLHFIHKFPNNYQEPTQYINEYVIIDNNDEIIKTHLLPYEHISHFVIDENNQHAIMLVTNNYGLPEDMIAVKLSETLDSKIIRSTAFDNWKKLGGSVGWSSLGHVFEKGNMVFFHDPASSFSVIHIFNFEDGNYNHKKTVDVSEYEIDQLLGVNEKDELLFASSSNTLIVFDIPNLISVEQVSENKVKLSQSYLECYQDLYKDMEELQNKLMHKEKYYDDFWDESGELNMYYQNKCEPLKKQLELDPKPEPSPITSSSEGGCLIATATYGSEMSQQVQQLRELRDNQLLQTESGKQFMGTFNDIYYSFSPVIADYERENPLFKEAVKLAITPMISTLSLMENAETDSEVLSIGISVIALNLGMYLGVPAVVIIGIRRRF